MKVGKIFAAICMSVLILPDIYADEPMVPEKKVLGIKLGSNVSKYNGAIMMEQTEIGAKYTIPKHSFMDDIPPLFEYGYKYSVVTKPDGTIYPLSVVANGEFNETEKVVDAIKEAYPDVAKPTLSLETLAYGKIGSGYELIVEKKLVGGSLTVVVVHAETLIKISKDNVKKNAKGL